MTPEEWIILYENDDPEFWELYIAHMDTTPDDEEENAGNDAD